MSSIQHSNSIYFDIFQSFFVNTKIITDLFNIRHLIHSTMLSGTASLEELQEPGKGFLISVEVSVNQIRDHHLK